VAALRIRWTEIAADDLQSLHQYLMERSPVQAYAMVERILGSIDVLEQYPNLGRVGRVEGTRELVIAGTPFVVFYRVHRDQVLILSILHGARKWPETGKI
jgi:toxin ParE1/3/4